jgi:hypothetical protein
MGENELVYNSAVSRHVPSIPLGFLNVPENSKGNLDKHATRIRTTITDIDGADIRASCSGIREGWRYDR